MTPAQNAILKAAVAAEPSLATAINTGDDYAIAAWLNGAFSPTFYVWKTAVPMTDIFDNITWANFTPQDVPDGTQLWLNRAMACQGKQFNVQTILVGRDQINPSKSNLRAGLQDALTAIPSGASGANKSGGWTAVVGVMSREASRAEKILATGTGTLATPALLTFEGQVSANDASVMR